MEKGNLEDEIGKLKEEAENAYDRTSKARDRASIFESYAKAIEIKQEDLTPPAIDTDKLFEDAWEDIQKELATPIPAFGSQKQWREDRREAIRQILTDAQNELFKAREVQKAEILKMGKALYQKAMKDANSLIEKNKALRFENADLTGTNKYLRMRLDSIDENAIAILRSEKEEEIKKLQARLDRANADANRSRITVNQERRRADNAEQQIKDMLAVPEIKQTWDTLQQNIQTFWKDIDEKIEEAKDAIYAFAKDYEHSIFTEEYTRPISRGIVGQALKDGLDVSDKPQRMKATHNLLGQISWKGTSDFMSDIAIRRTIDLSEGMNVTKKLTSALLLAAGGRGGISAGGVGVSGELTNWDGSKKKNGWGIS